MKGFFTGAATVVTLNKMLSALVLSDTQVGRDVRKNLLGRLDHDVLLRLEREVTREVWRRKEGRSDE